MTVELIRPASYLTFTAGLFLHRVDIATKDIGCTIGTKLTYTGVNGLGNRAVPLVAYRPGTRYHDRAEECAVVHLTTALAQVSLSTRVDATDVATLALCLAEVVQEDGCRLWDPHADEEDSW
ncbi:hypothetical protein J7I94_19220 [Streptomyces sp. ISL-12]|uniref:hypothetical protein n=1 Tax=Streptomyces sp. ISL-12 TaxID=2819177 RepID=UPI001BEBC001|nr:hypothetical protein [Streptomyces sp. ISL-12]MBT2412666.1 hypothetical protein [Streptomyces sp. ISL-12]